MSRTKGMSAQPGPQRWRQQPEQDASAYPGDHYAHDPHVHSGGSSHVPQDAFRRLGGVRNAPAPQHRELASALDRSMAGTQVGNERLSQRLQQAEPRAAGRSGWPPQADPAGYDLANYAPDQPTLGRGGVAHDPYAQSHIDAAAEGWTGGGWNQGYPEHQPEGADYGAPLDDADYGYDAEEEMPPVRRGPRAYMIGGALLGAIVAGGGLAYAYKSLGGSGPDGTTPIVRAERGPVKSKPADPGGKEIAHTDKKFINRLTDDRAGATPRFGDALAARDGGTGSVSDSDGGPRKVTTLVVNRDGSMAPPNPVVPLPQNGTSVASGGVPGMVIDGLNAPPRPQLRGPVAAESRGSAQKDDDAAAPAKPQVIARATPAPEPPQRETKRPVQREETRAAAVAPPAKPVATAAPAAASNGFVPVLSSQKTRMDALKAFADIQQKYTDVLQNRTPDVREVDLGEKGVWHRLVLGPPASREAASTVCTQLKAHGYSGCWVTAY